MKPYLTTAGPLFAVLCAATVFAANPGDLDTHFGAGNKIPGTVNRPIQGSMGNAAQALAIQEDGRIIVAGDANFADTSSDFATVRLEADGARDADFGINGQVVTDFGGQDELKAVALQPDGKIMVAGESWRQGSCSLVAARYLPDGALDNNFAAGGTFKLQSANGASAQAIAVQPDGKILLAGTGYEWNARMFMLLLRLNQDGTLDTAFGVNGVVTEDFGVSAQGKALALLPNGKILVAGVAWIDGWSFAVARYNADGTPDSAFGADGLAAQSVDDPNAACYAMALQSDGKILLAGEASIDASKNFALVRFAANGQTDASFGDNGMVITDISDFDSCRALQVLADDSILAAGGSSQSGRYSFFTLVKYTANGQPDLNFGENSITRTYLWQGAAAMAVAEDRVFLAGGGGYSPGLRGHCVACYTLTGYRDGGPAPGANLRARANKTRHAHATQVQWDLSVHYPEIDPQLIIAAMDEPFYGTVTNNADGSLTYYPQRRHYGYDAFTYTDLDGRIGLVSIYTIPFSYNDFDGDGRSDPAIYQAASGIWRARASGNGYAPVEIQLGGSGWLPLSADFDGDGFIDPAVYHTASGTWQARLSGNSYAPIETQLGGDGWLPLTADFDGDGLADPAVYHTASGTWQARLSGNSYAPIETQLGGDGWLPLAVDFDGDGLADPAVYHTSSGVWQVLLSGSAYAQAEFQLGGSGWLPLTADFDGDGFIDPAVYHEDSGAWQVLLSGSAYAQAEFQLGGSGWLPTAADFDGDGLTDPAVYNENSGVWRIMLSGSEYYTVSMQFGGPGFTPVR